MFPYEQFYDWRLECKCGTWTRSQNQALPEEDRIDFQSPPESLGRPLKVSIIPQRDNLPFISCGIPEGATPVVHFRHFKPEGSLIEIVYCRVGYNINGHRVMEQVELETGKRQRVEDDSGRVQMAGDNR